MRRRSGFNVFGPTSGLGELFFMLRDLHDAESGINPTNVAAAQTAPSTPFARSRSTGRRREFFECVHKLNSEFLKKGHVQ
jgi:hypothetical protein